jgi:epoxyqueuosine reductase
MKESAGPEVTRATLAQANVLGATLAGVVTFTAIRGVAAADALDSVWPAGAAALVVLALAHPESQPELDLWGVPGGTEGNRRLAVMAAQLGRWLREEYGVDAWPMRYQIDPSGVVLKDAAALAGLGAVGDANLLVTPGLGPRVRLRALAVAQPLEASSASTFRPCDGCPRPCHDACPQGAFSRGRYIRDRCAVQMAFDEGHPVEVEVEGPHGRRAVPLIRYCRACELACPVGRPG